MCDKKWTRACHCIDVVAAVVVAVVRACMQTPPQGEEAAGGWVRVSVGFTLGDLYITHMPDHALCDGNTVTAVKRNKVEPEHLALSTAWTWHAMEGCPAAVHVGNTARKYACEAKVGFCASPASSVSACLGYMLLLLRRRACHAHVYAGTQQKELKH
eukprot:1143678-Pelagomonas_calceolata.AAC.4